MNKNQLIFFTKLILLCTKLINLISDSIGNDREKDYEGFCFELNKKTFKVILSTVAYCFVYLFKFN